MVLLRLAIASKDGDWIVREDQEAIEHVLGVLEGHGAHYRFGAPLDLRWLCEGWSSHFEFQHGGMRIRTDFVTRPPRVTPPDLAVLWREQEGKDPPFTGPRILLEIAAAAGLEKVWPDIQRQTAGLPLHKAHALLVDSAPRCLPTSPGLIPPATSS